MEPHVSELPGDLAAHCAALAASATAPDATVIEQLLGTFSSDIAASAPPASGVPYSRKRLHLTDDGRARHQGKVFAFGSGVIHDMVAAAGGVTLHLYSTAARSSTSSVTSARGSPTPRSNGSRSRETA